MTIRKIKTLNLKVAAEKSEIVVFKNKKDPETELIIEIEDKYIRSEKVMKYLGGIMLDNELNFLRHIKYIQEKVNKV